MQRSSFISTIATAVLAFCLVFCMLRHLAALVRRAPVDLQVVPESAVADLALVNTYLWDPPRPCRRKWPSFGLRRMNCPK